MRSIAHVSTPIVARPTAAGSIGSVATIAQVASASVAINASAIVDAENTTRTGGGQCMPP
jgi:hypothetical protein